MSEPILALSNISKAFVQGERVIEVLRDVSLALEPGEIVALVAPSGSGKSTLLHIAGLLDRPDSGQVRIAGQEMQTASDQARTTARRGDIGMIYQAHHLLPEFSAVENVMIPQRAAGVSERDASLRSTMLLESVGLAPRATHRPAELSGGEAQRVAIARALANQPRLLLADEPTGNLDPDTSERAFTVLLDLVRKTGLAALVATHNMELAARMDRVVRLTRGRLG